MGILTVLRFVVCGGGGGGVVRVSGDGVVVIGMIGWFGILGVVSTSCLVFDIGSVGSVFLVFGDVWLTCGIGGCGILFGGEIVSLVFVVCFFLGIV